MLMAPLYLTRAYAYELVPEVGGWLSGEPSGYAIRGLEVSAHPCPPGTEEGLRGYLLISKL